MTRGGTIKREQYRNKLLSIVDNSKITRKEIASNYKSIFSWLYRNDKIWLYQNLPDVAKRNTERKTADWVERDRYFYQQILLKYAKVEQKVKKSELIRGIDGLRRYENQINKMPMTLNLITTLSK
ncbi:TnsD family Tn7-like transposition protein [Deferribacteres bacterium DY0037]